MRAPLAGLLFAAALLLQGIVANHLTIFGVGPNLIVCLAVLFPFLYSSAQGMAFGVISGLLFDLSYSPFIGPTALACLAAGVSTILLRLFLDRDNLLSLMLAGLAGTITFYLLEWIQFTVWGEHIGFLYALGRLPAFVAVNLLILLLYYLIVGRKAIRFRGDRTLRGSLPYYE